MKKNNLNDNNAMMSIIHTGLCAENPNEQDSAINYVPIRRDFDGAVAKTTGTAVSVTTNEGISVAYAPAVDQINAGREWDRMEDDRGNKYLGFKGTVGAGIGVKSDTRRTTMAYAILAGSNGEKQKGVCSASEPAVPTYYAVTLRLSTNDKSHYGGQATKTQNRYKFRGVESVKDLWRIKHASTRATVATTIATTTTTTIAETARTSKKRHWFLKNRYNNGFPVTEDVGEHSGTHVTVVCKNRLRKTRKAKGVRKGTTTIRPSKKSRPFRKSKKSEGKFADGAFTATAETVVVTG